MGRNITFAEGEFYHVYHRGNDKREIFHDTFDFLRFLEGLEEFNSQEAIGGLYVNSFNKESGDTKPLVKILAYNILDNHFHIVIQLLVKDGLSRYMKSQLGGYTKYYNEKYKHTGPIFAGPYKCKHISSQGYLDYVLRYVHFNHLVHKLRNPVSKFIWSSWSEIMGDVSRRLVDDWSHTCIPEKKNEYEKHSKVVVTKIQEERKRQKEIRNKDELIQIIME